MGNCPYPVKLKNNHFANFSELPIYFAMQPADGVSKK